ncbi:hypothetical protein [Xanthobacter aminoxidans]|uniref:Uncharacterized protein n=1 Tax=Xanthobacter aminoxidans TaxID=186280 RepID=A0ABW6ZC78_9HYPH
MKVRMLVSMAGVGFALAPGEVTERFGDEEATRLVLADYAVVIASSAETAVQAPVGEVRSGGGEPAATAATPAADPPPGEGKPSPNAAAIEPLAGVSEAPSAAYGEAGEGDVKAALQSEAETFEIDVDKRWGVARLNAEIEAARAKATG